MALGEICSFILRLAQLVFAAIVAGISGRYIHVTAAQTAWEQSRFIYTLVVASLAMLIALLWLFPFSRRVTRWPGDFIMFVLFIIAFGLIVNYLNGRCGYYFYWDGLGFTGTDTCPTWRADFAFTFLSAMAWLASSMLDFYLWHREAPSHPVA